MSSRPEFLAPCRLCGTLPGLQGRPAAHAVSCGNCGLRVKQSQMGANDAAERWNALNASSPGFAAAEVAQEVALCQAHRVGLQPGRAYRFVVRTGCAKCEAWHLWNLFARGEGPAPAVGHPLLTGGACHPAFEVIGPEMAPNGAGRAAARAFAPPELLERH